MPLRWTIDHSQRLVEVFADGESGPDEYTAMLDAIEDANAVPYRKLLDATRLKAGPSAGNNMPAFASRIAAYAHAGPFAVLVAPGPADGLARLFLLLADAQGRARVFRDAAEARQWLDSQAQEASRSSVRVSGTPS